MCNVLNDCGVVTTLKTHKYVNVVPSVEDVDFDVVYYFTDPDLVTDTFKFLAGNREKINTGHVNDICNAYLNPIYANYVDSIRIDINTMFVTDGQHRIKAWLKAVKDNTVTVPLKVRFENVKFEDLMPIIIGINCGSKPWSIKDFTNNLETIGDVSAINTKKFGETHRLTAKFNKKTGEVVGYYPRYVYAILLGRNATKEIKNGTFEVSKKDLKFGEMIYHELEMIFDCLGYEMNAWFESFAQSWYNLRKNDGAYNDLIQKVGFETIVENLPKWFEGFHPVTKKGEWDKRFRYAIYGISKA